MTNAQHLIENAIMHLCRTGKLLEADVNESHCSCTLAEANDMAQHIVWSLYNGLSPNDVDRLQEERDAAVADIKPFCSNCRYFNQDIMKHPCNECCNGNAYGGYNLKWEWRGLSLASETSDKRRKKNERMDKC